MLAQPDGTEPLQQQQQQQQQPVSSSATHTPHQRTASCDSLGRPALHAAALLSPPPPHTHPTHTPHPAGGELWTKIKRGEYHEAQAARLVHEVLLAVAQCHAKGIVIRDVKPENFLFLNSEEGAPLKMIDFGIATYCQPGG